MTKRLRERPVALVSLAAIVSGALTLGGSLLGTGFCSSAPWNAATKDDVQAVQKQVEDSRALHKDLETKEEAAKVKDRVLIMETNMTRMQQDVTKVVNGIDEVNANLYQLMTNVGIEPRRGRRRP